MAKITPNRNFHIMNFFFNLATLNIIISASMTSYYIFFSFAQNRRRSSDRYRTRAARRRIIYVGIASYEKRTRGDKSYFESAYIGIGVKNGTLIAVAVVVLFVVVIIPNIVEACARGWREQKGKKCTVRTIT